MDEEIYHKTHKRIRELNPAGEQGLEPDPLAVMLTDAERKCWYAAVDSYQDPDDPQSEIADDTLALRCDRLLMLGQGRMVPAVNLPSYISARTTDGIYNSVNELPDPGDIDYVYVVHEGNIFKYYRWVETDVTTGYVSIPYNRILKDGNGIVVVDLNGEYERKFDVDIGTPSTRDSDILALTGNKLVHTMSGVVTDGTIDKTRPEPNQQVTTPGFGDSFYVPKFTVDSTGHTTNLDTYTVTVPDTPASTANPGLVMIGGTVQPIASTCDIGSASSGGYTLLAAADHTHKALKLKFTNLPNASPIEYDMTTKVTLDMKDTIRALPPSNQPGIENILNTDSTTTTKWSSVDAFFSKTMYTEWTPEDPIPPVASNTTLGRLTVKANCLLLVTVQIAISIPSSLSQSNVPDIYTCDFVLGTGTNKQTRTYSIPGEHAHSLSDKICFACLIKTEPNETELPLTATIVDNSNQPVNIFIATCSEVKAVELM